MPFSITQMCLSTWYILFITLVWASTNKYIVVRHFCLLRRSFLRFRVLVVFVQAFVEEFIMPGCLRKGEWWTKRIIIILRWSFATSRLDLVSLPYIIVLQYRQYICFGLEDKVPHKIMYVVILFKRKQDFLRVSNYYA